MNEVITILVVLFSGYQIEVEYQSRSSCGDALGLIASSGIEHDGAFCVPWYAPTRSYRPVARP